MAEIKLKFEDESLVPDEQDDQTARYLLSRQVSHEYNAPAVQDLIQADRAAEQSRQQAMMSEMDEFRKEQSQKQTEGKAAASSFAETVSGNKPIPT